MFKHVSEYVISKGLEYQSGIEQSYSRINFSLSSLYWLGYVHSEHFWWIYKQISADQSLKEQRLWNMDTAH